MISQGSARNVRTDHLGGCAFLSAARADHKSGKGDRKPMEKKPKKKGGRPIGTGKRFHLDGRTVPNFLP